MMLSSLSRPLVCCLRLDGSREFSSCSHQPDAQQHNGGGAVPPLHDPQQQQQHHHQQQHHPQQQHQQQHHQQQQQQQHHQQQLLHTQPRSSMVVEPLSEQQQAELTRAILGSFKQDSATASSVLARALNDKAKQQVLAALEGSKEKPELSRTAMVDDAAAPSSSPSTSSSTALTAPADAAAAVPEPTFKQLLRVAVTKGLPFVAFGFFDNIIMITAGEQIDLTFGAKLGLSSMAAAGLGNTVADVVGINISHTIEQKFKRMKSMAPALTKAQLALPRTQRAKWLGCAIGMASGCLLGLTPLLFYETAPHEGGSCSSGAAGRDGGKGAGAAAAAAGS